MVEHNGKFLVYGPLLLMCAEPCTDVASNLLAIDLQLAVQIACDGLQQKFQNAEYFTCDPLIFFTFFFFSLQGDNTLFEYEIRKMLTEIASELSE